MNPEIERNLGEQPIARIMRELYWDRPMEQWPRSADGGLAMFTHPLDLDALLKESP